MQKSKRTKAYSRLLYEMTKDVSEETVGTQVKAFVELTKKKKLPKSFWKNFFTTFGHIYNKEEGIVEAHVTLRSKITPEEREEVLHFIKGIYKDKKITLIDHVDERVLGGIKILIEDKLFDFTVQNSLRSLEKQLIHK